MNIDRIAAETRRLHLKATGEYMSMLRHNPQIIAQIGNGVGSPGNLLYHFIPNTIWGLNIFPSATIHDFDYTFPLDFPTVRTGLEHKRNADFRFSCNVSAQIQDGIWLLRGVRETRLEVYAFALKMYGEAAFWADKPLPRDFKEHYKGELNPIIDSEKYAKYNAWQIEINQLPKGAK